LGYPFQYICADAELHPCRFLFIHITGQLFHIALYPRIFERISQVASTGEDPKIRHPIITFTPYATSIGFPFLTLLCIWYVLREKASKSGSERKGLANEDGSSL
jgi:hypothetical protein